MRFATFLLLLSLSSQSLAFEITNFTSGLACTDGHSFGWICHDTEVIHLTGQGRCNWDGEEYPCTWYGFEFEYSGNKVGDAIDCQYSTSQSADAGNPQEVISEESNEGTFTLQLKDESGRFYNPQYSLFAVQSEQGAIQRTETTCYKDGDVLFEFRFQIHYPVSG